MSAREILALVTGRDDWDDMDGPDSGRGVDDWYINGDSQEAYVNDDQGVITIVVDGEAVFCGEARDLAVEESSDPGV